MDTRKRISKLSSSSSKKSLSSSSKKNAFASLSLDLFTCYIDFFIKLIPTYLTILEQIRLSNTCKALHKQGHFKLLLNPNNDRRDFIQLAQALIDNKQVEVKRILDIKPDLLVFKLDKSMLLRSQYTFQNICVEYPLTMALKRHQLEMVQLLLPYFKKLKDKNGHEEALTQWNFAPLDEIYNFNNLMQCISTDVLYYSHHRKTNDQRDLRLSDKANRFTEIAMNEFRNKMLNSGQPYDIQRNLVAALNLYYEVGIDLNGPSSEFYSINVIGFLMSLLPPELAEIFCGRSDRKLIIDDQSLSFYRENIKSKVGLGFDFVCTTSGKTTKIISIDQSHGITLDEFCTNLFEKRNDQLAELKNKWEVKIKSKPCVIQ